MAKDHDPLPMPDLASLVAKHDSEIAAIRSDIGDVKSGLSKIFDRMESMHRENTGRISSLEQRSSGLEQKASSKGTFSLPVVVAFTGGLLTLLLGVLATAAGAVVFVVLQFVNPVKDSGEKWQASFNDRLSQVATAITRADDNSIRRHDEAMTAARSHESEAMHPGTFAEFQKVNQQLQRVETQMHAMSVLNNERAETTRTLMIMGWPADRPKPEPLRNFPIFGTDTGVPHSYDGAPSMR